MESNRLCTACDLLVSAADVDRLLIFGRILSMPVMNMLSEICHLQRGRNMHRHFFYAAVAEAADWQDHLRSEGSALSRV